MKEGVLNHLWKVFPRRWLQQSFFPSFFFLFETRFIGQGYSKSEKFHREGFKYTGFLYNADNLYKSYMWLPDYNCILKRPEFSVCSPLAGIWTRAKNKAAKIITMRRLLQLWPKFTSIHLP